MAAKSKIHRASDPTPTQQICCPCPAYTLNICQPAFAAYGSKQATAGLQVRQVARSAMARRLVCQQQELRDGVPVICDGWAACYINLPNNGRQILSIILPGELVSTALVFETIQNWFIEAITDVQYRTFKRSDLLEVLFKRPEAFECISRAWVEERKRADQLILDLGCRLAEERIPRLIVQLVKRLKALGMSDPDGNRFPFPLRHHHIADATGLTPVHVSKVLSELRRRNVLALSDRFLVILDPVALYHAAGEKWS